MLCGEIDAIAKSHDFGKNPTLDVKRDILLLAVGMWNCNLSMPHRVSAPVVHDVVHGFCSQYYLDTIYFLTENINKKNA